MLTVLYKGDGVFTNYAQVRSDSTCPLLIDVPWLVVGDAAVSLQSLSLLALATGNSSLMNDLRDITRYATNSSGPWHTSDGVLDTRKTKEATRAEDSDNENLTQQLLRSVYELAIGDSSASDLKTYTRRYLAVQYNALVDQTTFASSAQNMYGPGFTSTTQFSNNTQMRAITTLLGGVISEDDSTDVTPNDPRASNDVNHGRPPIGVIVGGVVGGVAGLVLVVAAGCCSLRRRHSGQMESPAVEPYLAMTSPMPPPPFLPFQQGKHKKWMPPGPLASRSIAGTSASESLVLTPLGSAPEFRLQSTHSREATTAELVTLLNQRLGIEPRNTNSGQWDAHESPPEYRSQAGSRV
ncbi:hypothetical protein PM082_015746 [Marasmius tenuissimus]|nr:hypothetical protein PM082_015746 [Marasmius tenuissimus]